MSHETFNSTHLRPGPDYGHYTGAAGGEIRSEIWGSHSGTAEESAIPGRDAVYW